MILCNPHIDAKDSNRDLVNSFATHLHSILWLWYTILTINNICVPMIYGGMDSNLAVILGLIENKNYILT